MMGTRRPVIRVAVGVFLILWLTVAPALATPRRAAPNFGFDGGVTALLKAEDVASESELLTVGYSASEQPQNPPVDERKPVPAWKVGMWKTFTYRVAASIDAFVVGWWWTGSFFGGLGIKALNAVISSTLYDLHEMAWSYFGPDPQTVSTVKLSAWKTVCYRMISIANVFLTALAFTGDPLLSIGLSLGNAVIDSTIYFFHELAWSYYGPPIDNGAVQPVEDE
ncbi:membrane hypothetical protein [Azospirillaceae bacterium]